LRQIYILVDSPCLRDTYGPRRSGPWHLRRANYLYLNRSICAVGNEKESPILQSTYKSAFAAFYGWPGYWTK